jgi:predicted HTH transcriptional regulator
MHQNSVDAYKSIRESLSEKQTKVLAIVERNPFITRQSVAERLGWQINQVTGRVKELLLVGAIEESGKIIVNGRSRAILVPRRPKPVAAEVQRQF